MSAVKSTIKKLLVAKEQAKYRTELKSKNMDYNAWAHTQKWDEFPGYEAVLKSLTIDNFSKNSDGSFEVDDRKLAEYNQLCKLFEVKSTSDCGNCATQYLVCDFENLPQTLEILKSLEIKPQGVILKKSDGKLSKKSVEKISFEFLRNKNLIVIYSDEDIMDETGYRKDPWFKPDWAPDDFLSYFYFGGMCAIRTDAFLELPPRDDEGIYDYMYKLLLFNRAFDKHPKNDGNPAKYEDFAVERVLHIPEVLFHGSSSTYEWIKTCKIKSEIRQRSDEALISIIIPSKDHPDILLRCIDSLIEKTKLPENIKYELIVVDNGSNDANRTLLEGVLKNYGAKYIYEKKDFNFSYMCNKGAASSKGNYLLFLNDDMEIIESDWLLKLVSKAFLPYAGCVGCKLLYPDSDTIQHAGITNLRIGPAHKLQFLSDSEDHYFGRNRYVHDMLAVTGACLLINRDIFNEVGGFDETLAVAFNDVDLCYSVYEKGYYNIERCDVKLYHHESLSRGNDAKSEEKQLRLNKEKDYLYEKHEVLYGRDPFYNVNLTTDMWEYEYAPKYHYEVKLDKKWAKVTDITDVINAARLDKCVRVGMECAMDIFKWKYGVSKEKSSISCPSNEDSGYYFQGYTFVIGADNACFERQLFLKNTASGRFYGIEVDKEFRPDIAGNVPDQLNVDLAGYTAKIKADILPEGHYQFGMYMKDNTSSLRLYNMSNWTLDV